MNNQKNLVDMHLHSSYSNGLYDPISLAKKASYNNYKAVAITDIETINGIKKLDDYLKYEFIWLNIYYGIEFNVEKLNILGYGIDIYNEDLNNKLKEIKSNNINKIVSIIEILKRKFNIYLSNEDIKNIINLEKNIGKIDIAKILIKNGQVSSLEEAFDKLNFAYNKVKDINKSLSYEEVIDLILKSKGIPILAYPKTLEISKKEFLTLLKNMMKLGLQGIEVYHPNHTKNDQKYFLEVANRYNLLISGGGYFNDNLKIDNNFDINSLSIINALNEKEKEEKKKEKYTRLLNKKR